MVIKFLLCAFFFIFFGFVLGVIQCENAHKKELLLRRLVTDEPIKIISSEKDGDSVRYFVRRELDE